MVLKIEQCISDLLLLKPKCDKIQSEIPCTLLHHTSLECKKSLHLSLQNDLVLMNQCQTMLGI